jgi:NADH-quinone oxidoreductase subunit D
MMFYERASGARMHANYFRVGGVHQDPPPKLIDEKLARPKRFELLTPRIRSLMRNQLSAQALHFAGANRR